MPQRAERRPDGWYDTERERFVPLLRDVYWAGGFMDRIRTMMKRLEDLERRG